MDANDIFALSDDAFDVTLLPSPVEPAEGP